MSLASPVWRTMLNPEGPFQESKPDNHEVEFHDDDTEALLTILLAAHQRNQEIPQSIELRQLLNICLLCDKYDCLELVRSWLFKWEADLKASADIGRYDQWLFIAWTTGDMETFNRIAYRIGRESSVDDSGQLLNADGEVLGRNMPPGILGQYQLSVRLSYSSTDLHEQKESLMLALIS